MTLLKPAGAALLLALAACTAGGRNTGIADGADGASGSLGADEISAALGGKTFAYTGAGMNGTIIYAADGSSLYTEDGKGNGTGKWQARDGQLCQSFDPTDFLPSGRPATCANFSRSGNGYAAGPIKLTDISG